MLRILHGESSHVELIRHLERLVYVSRGGASFEADKARRREARQADWKANLLTGSDIGDASDGYTTRCMASKQV